jgi:GntR family transcriptional regulator
VTDVQQAADAVDSVGAGSIPAETPAMSELAAETQLVEAARLRLLEIISAETLRPGDKLGTERELAMRLSVSRSTLRQVLAVLAQTGVVRRVPGRAGGTFMAQAKVDRDLSVVVGLPEYLRRQGFVAGTRTLSATITSADGPTAERLSLPARSLVIDIVRIRLADGIPLSLERAMFPAEMFPGLLDLPLGGSIYDLLSEHYGVSPDNVVEHMEIAEAADSDAAALGVAIGAPLLAISRTSSTADGRVFEWSYDLFRSDRTRVTFRTRAERAEIVSIGALA